MRLQKVYSLGRIINAELYQRLIHLDLVVFPDCGNEFIKDNREWWVIQENGKIVAFCGCLYTPYGICIFNRAWVYKPYRGKGIQKKMIKARIKAAKQHCTSIITYTTTDNIVSANNLLKLGFLLYIPKYKWVGEQLYFYKYI